MSDRPNDYVEVYADASGEHRWRYKAANGQTLADSGEGYRDQRDALTAVGIVTGRTPAIIETKGAEPLLGPDAIRVVIRSRS